MWRAYTRLMERYPWGSQILQTGTDVHTGASYTLRHVPTHIDLCSGVLVATGDVIAQTVVERLQFLSLYFLSFYVRVH